MKIHVLTLFPEMFAPVTEASILGKAGEKGILDVNLINIRDFSKDKHKKVDDYPFGGGAGMVMQPGPVYRAYEHVKEKIDSRKKNPQMPIYRENTKNRSHGSPRAVASLFRGKNRAHIAYRSACSFLIAL